MSILGYLVPLASGVYLQAARAPFQFWALILLLYYNKTNEAQKDVGWWALSSPGGSNGQAMTAFFPAPTFHALWPVGTSLLPHKLPSCPPNPQVTGPGFMGG